MKYDYEYRLHPDVLVVQVWVGHDSEFKLPFPHVWTGEYEAEVWYPPGCLPVDHTAVAHEGVHLAKWGMDAVPYSMLRRLVPKVDMCWEYGKAAVQEEALARMVDRHVANFYYRAKLNGMEIVMPKITELPRTIDDDAYYDG